MPGTTRYSATFDRTYEEEDPPVARRSRSQSWQVESMAGIRGGCGPLFSGTLPQHVRSSSNEGSEKAPAPKGAEVIPTRTTGKTTVKTHNNPFQFVKVGTCPLYKSAEEQLKKTKEVKKAPVIKEEEEEWQSNLDSWKLRRRKVSEGAFRRQEELRKLELEEQNANNQQQQKKIKKFSEMVEERAHRGRALSLCLFSSPLDSSEWIFENTNRGKRNGSHDLLSGGSAESSNINSDEENDHYSKQSASANGEQNADNELNGVRNSTSNSSISKTSDLSELDVSQESISQKEQITFGGFIDSGLESLSSSHRTGDIADSGSDFSQDSGSSIDCDSPRVSGLITTGIELLEEFSSKESHVNGSAASLEKKSAVCESSEKAKPSSKVPSTESNTCSKTSTTKNLNPTTNNKELKPKTVKATKSSNKPAKGNKSAVTKSKASSTPEKSVESENEMFVDDFEELARLRSLESEATTSPQPQKNATNLANSHTLLNDSSLNVIYQSQPVHNRHAENSKASAQADAQKNSSDYTLISEIPVEKVTEEMEKLILQQLEEDERAKEISVEDKLDVDKTDLDAPLRKAEPPKEKPPPPPVMDSPTKDCSIKRMNSTKRILKEINKRRSDFLGIDQADQESMNEGLSVPPPPALTDILRAEREQDKLRRQMMEAVSKAEEDEIARKEREIINNVETEERLKSVQNNIPDFTDSHIDEERIKLLKEERKRMEEEILLAEEHRIRLEEAALLQKREKQIKQQEDVNSAEQSASLPSLDAPVTNAGKSETSLAVSNANFDKNGDGQNNESSLSSNSGVEPTKPKEPPSTAPKPPKKKKEVLRKERERLRQEQEALQREREEHRRKMLLEQEQLKKSLPSSHVLDAPVSQVGPPPPAKPTLSSQSLTHPSPTSSSSSSQSSSKPPPKREVPASGLPNCNKPTTVGSTTSDYQSHGKPRSKAHTSPSRSKAVANESKSQPKAPLPRKQESPAEIRYNQNHWLIQEAEMRRIREQTERQRVQGNSLQYPTQNIPVKVPAYSLQGQQQQYTPVSLSMHCAVVPPQHPDASHYLATYSKPFESSMAAPMKPSRVMPVDRQEQMLSVSGRKRCSHCGTELGRGAAMIIESLQLYYHIHCFRCCVCEAQLGNGSCGTDVRVRNNKLHCHNCYSNDEAGLKFSQV